MTLSRWFRFSALMVFSALTCAQDLTPELRTAVNERIKLQRSWGKRLNSPGAQLYAVEVVL